MKTFDVMDPSEQCRRVMHGFLVVAKNEEGVPPRQSSHGPSRAIPNGCRHCEDPAMRMGGVAGRRWSRASPQSRPTSRDALRRSRPRVWADGAGWLRRPPAIWRPRAARRRVGDPSAPT